MKSLLLLASVWPAGRPGGASRRAHRRERRPYKREQRRCPVCGRACDFYDMANRGAPGCGGRWTWALGLLPGVRALQGALPGARVAPRPSLGAARGALHARLRGLGGVAGGPLHRPGGLELARVEWHSVGACAGASTPSWSRARRLEVRRRAPHRHRRDVVQEGPQVRHGGRRPRPRLPHLGHEGTGKDVLNLFLDELTREQRRAIEVVTADGARWIRQLVKRRCPNARWVMDPFHVVQWMNDALDAVRCEEWNAARAAQAGNAGGLPKASCRPRRSGRSRRRRPPSRAAATRS